MSTSLSHCQEIAQKLSQQLHKTNRLAEEYGVEPPCLEHWTLSLALKDELARLNEGRTKFAVTKSFQDGYECGLDPDVRACIDMDSLSDFIDVSDLSADVQAFLSGFSVAKNTKL